MLFKDKYFEKYKSGVAGSLAAFSRGSATSILIIWDAVRYQFYQVDLGVLVDELKNALSSSDLPGATSLVLSEDLKAALQDESFLKLSAYFYHYYFHRLPILFRSGIQHHGKRRTLSRKEVDDTVRNAISQYSREFGSLDMPLSPEQYLLFKNLSGRLVRAQKRDDEVYSIQWLWGALRTTHSELLQGNNISSITTHVIESSFPMFWDSFQESYQRFMVYFAVMGYFVGDSDIDEIEAELKRSEL